MRYIIYNEEEDKKLGGILQMAYELDLWFELLRPGRLFAVGTGKIIVVQLSLGKT